MYICFLVVLTASLVSSRKYDVESEAVRLYGEDFPTVLKRFRRTADYLKILQEKYNDMGISFYEVNVQTMQYIEAKISQRVTEMLGHHKDETTTAVIDTPPPKIHFRGERDDDTSDVTESPITKLDNYDLLHKESSTQERNKFKDLGFEMAGQMIHLIIKGMGPVEPKINTDTTMAFPKEDHTIEHRDNDYVQQPTENTYLKLKAKNKLF